MSKISKLILIYFLIPTLTFALDCKDGAYEVIVPLLSQNKRIEFCQITKNGVLQKHGVENIYDSNNKLLETNNYKYGEKEKFEKLGIPGVSEKSQAFTDGIVTPSVDNPDSLPKRNYALRFFWHLIFLHHAPHPIIEHKMQWQGCKDQSKELMLILLQRRPHTFKYQFSEKCDVQGEIVVDQNLKGQLNLETRNYGPYNHVEAKGEIKLSQEGMAIKIIISVDQSSLKGAKGETTLKGEYLLRYDPIANSNEFQGLGGKIIYQKIMGQEIK